MPLTMIQIERWTKRVTEQRSLDVKVTRLQKGKRRNGNTVVRAVTFTTHNDDGTLRRNPNKYKTWVEGLSRDKKGRPKMLIDRCHVKCSCDCDYFWAYGCEVELNKRGAADIVFSNGKDPIIRNPNGRPWACKHLISLFHTIQERGF